jgi:Arc/MetJ-type ribon-helix-helix transcriptional regulator
MSTERTTLSAQVDSDTELAKQFEEYREQNAMTSRSEAVRHLVRAGLEQELSKQTDDDAADSTASGQSAGQPATDPDISINLLRGSEPVLLALAYVFGYSDFQTATRALAGPFWGQLLFAGIGVAILAAMMPMFVRAVLDVSQGLIDSVRKFRDDDADANASGVQG